MSQASTGVITEGEAIRLLVGACPSFAEEWGVLKAEWKESIDDDDFVAEGTTATAIARHLIERFEAGDMTPFPMINPAIDAILTRGDRAAQELVVVSLIDELKDSDNYTSREPNELRKVLGTVTQRKWLKPGDWRDDVHIPISQWIYIILFSAGIVTLALWMGLC